MKHSNQPVVDPALPTVVVVEDHSFQRDAMAAIVDPRFQVIAAFPNVETFLESGLTPSVVVLDMWIDPLVKGEIPMVGARAIAAVKEVTPRILIYTAETRPLVLAGLLAVGGHGLAIKTEPPEHLIEAVAAVARGDHVLTGELVGLAYAVHRSGRLPSLSARQIALLQARATGEPYADIARRLSYSVKHLERDNAVINGKFMELLYAIGPALELEPNGKHSAALIAKSLGLAAGDLLDTTSRDPA